MLTELTDVELKPNLLRDCEDFLKKKRKKVNKRDGEWSMVNDEWQNYLPILHSLITKWIEIECTSQIHHVKKTHDTSQHTLSSDGGCD